MSSTHGAYNLARFDLVSIRLAVACVLTGSLTAAASESRLALAAASRRIRSLEASLGGPLFERSKTGLKPTVAGRIFAKHGMALLQSIELMDGELKDYHGGVGRHIRLWASTAAINQFLPPVLARYGRKVPQVQIDLTEQVSEVVVASLRDGRADAGIFVEGANIEGLKTRVFAHDELVLVLPVDHWLANERSPIAFSETISEDYVGLAAGAALLLRQQQEARTCGRPLKMRMQVRSFDVVCHMVASKLGIAVLPKASVVPIMQTMRLVTRPLADPWARRRILIANRAAESDPVILGLVGFLAENGV